MSLQLGTQLKNIPGWRTNEKIVVFLVDDYGSVCLSSKKAKENLESKGVRLNKHIERIDALETRTDLEMLFEALVSVRDSRGRFPVWTANVLCANPDFDSLLTDPSIYKYNTLPETFDIESQLQPKAYNGVWPLWRSGIYQGLLQPQFHGREHLNVELLMRKVHSHDRTTLLNIANRSMAGIGSEPTMPGISPTHAFAGARADSLAAHEGILADGVTLFAEIFGHKPEVLVPPAMDIHPKLYGFVEGLGIGAIDKPQVRKQRLAGYRIPEFNRLGIKGGQSHVTLVRNVVFEPTKSSLIDSVALAMNQVEAAFRWRKPAIISSHRVNFAGHIDENNRRTGLSELGRLLKSLVRKWPQVKFMGAEELVKAIRLTG